MMVVFYCPICGKHEAGGRCAEKDLRAIDAADRAARARSNNLTSTAPPPDYQKRLEDGSLLLNLANDDCKE